MTNPHIELIDTASASEEVLRALHELYVVWDKERVPNDPVMPLQQRLADWSHLTSFEDVPRWVARVGDDIVGTSGLFLNLNQDLDNSWGWVYVLPEYRKQGLGKQLAGVSVEYAAAKDRKRYATFIEAGSDFDFWPKRLGLKPVYNERISQLRLADVDREMVRHWIDRAAERAGEYEVIFLSSPIEDEYIDQMVELAEVMNTAPLEDMEEDPFHWTVAELRDVEKKEAAKNRTILTCVARHMPTGQFAGYTMVAMQGYHPKLAHQWDTGVDPEHRNLGLGRWVKAAMLERIFDEYPQTEIIETENAESNDPMLNINVALGFKPSFEQVIHQGPTTAALDYLG